MPDRELPVASDPATASGAWRAAAPAALEGLTWIEESDLRIRVTLPAVRADGGEDVYLARFDFTWYPTWPPSVIFLDPSTLAPAKTAWPQVKDVGHVAFHPDYEGTPGGMVCNSMFFEFYFWGGHAKDGSHAWDPRRHTFAASINVLRDVLKPPYHVDRPR
jgi:hypothetical protein